MPIGLFDVIQAELEGDELFDSVAVDKKFDELIAAGKRNFAVDLSALDYIYSDAINRFVNINHKVLNVYGRMALVGPTPQVRQILQRAGVHNFIRIYDNTEELLRASNEIIQQTSAVNIGDIRTMQQQAPAAAPAQSEFEDLRSAIGSAIPPATPVPQAYQQPVQPPQQQQAPLSFTPMSPPPAPAPVPPPAPVPQQMQQRAPQQPSFGGVPQFEQQAAPQPQSRPSAQPQFAGENTFDDEPPARSGLPVPAIIGGVLAVVLLAVGAIVFFMMSGSKKEAVTETPAATAPASVEQTAPAPEPAAPTAPAPKATEKSGAKGIAAKAASNESTGTIVITSTPSGAGVYVNGKFRGATPYTWADPEYGMLNISLDLAGYEKATQTVEFVGDNIRRSFVLSKKADQAADASKAKAADAARAAEAARMAEAANAQAEAKAAADAARAKAAADAAKAADAARAADATRAAEAAKAAAAAADAARAKAAADAAKAADASKPKGDPATIFISSLPPMADVYLDGKLIGKTNLAELKVTAGAHTVEFVKGEKRTTKQMTFQPGKNPAQMVTF